MPRPTSGLNSPRKARRWFRTRILPYAFMFSPGETVERLIGFIDHYGIWPLPYEPLSPNEEALINLNAEVFKVLIISMIRLLVREEEVYEQHSFLWHPSARFQAFRTLSYYITMFVRDCKAIVPVPRSTDTVLGSMDDVQDALLQALSLFTKEED